MQYLQLKMKLCYFAAFENEITQYSLPLIFFFKIVQVEDCSNHFLNEVHFLGKCISSISWLRAFVSSGLSK